MLAQTAPDTLPVGASLSRRTVVVIDRDLPKGLAANAAAVLALTLGAREPALPGADFADGAGGVHAGLFPTGLPILGASADELRELRARALERGLRVVDLPAVGQRTNDYEEFRAAVGAAGADELTYVGVLVSGEERAVRKLTSRFGLLR